MKPLNAPELFEKYVHTIPYYQPLSILYEEKKRLAKFVEKYEIVKFEETVSVCITNDKASTFPQMSQPYTKIIENVFILDDGTIVPPNEILFIGVGLSVNIYDLNPAIKNMLDIYGFKYHIFELIKFIPESKCTFGFDTFPEADRFSFNITYHLGVENKITCQSDMYKAKEFLSKMEQIDSIFGDLHRKMLGDIYNNHGSDLCNDYHFHYNQLTKLP